MRTLKSCCLALMLILAGLAFAPTSTASADDPCLVCVRVEIPPPDGGPEIIDYICLSLGDEYGSQECFEGDNGCFELFICYWSWP